MTEVMKKRQRSPGEKIQREFKCKEYHNWQSQLYLV